MTCQIIGATSTSHTAKNMPAITMANFATVVLLRSFASLSPKRLLQLGDALTKLCDFVLFLVPFLAPPQLQLDQRPLLLAVQALLQSDLELFRAKIGERGQQVGDLVLGFGHWTPAVGYAILQ